MAAQDKTITILGATTVCHSVQFSRVTVPIAGVPTAKIQATAYGSADRSDGTKDNESVSWILAGGAETTALAFLNGQAVMRLREKMGLEAP